MGRYICKLNDLYFEWSTILAAPVTYGMTLDEFNDYYQNTYGTSSMANLMYRLERADAKGTSSFDDDSLDELIAFNHAGEGGSSLTKGEIYKMITGKPNDHDPD